MKVFQKGFNYSQDGPGNRLVYHLQGCNFHCKWCSNPESMPLESDSAKDYTPAQIIDEIKRSRMMFFDGGGVTFTGGEPTLQWQELIEVLKGAKEMGVNTAIENNGSSVHLSEISEYVDYLIMDIKIPDDKKHMEYIGASNRQTVENIKNLAKKRSQLHLRIPLINNINTDADAFVELFDNVDMSHTVVEVLTYHEYGKCKWTDEYEIHDGFVSDETLKEFTDKLTTAGVQLVRT